MHSIVLQRGLSLSTGNLPHSTTHPRQPYFPLPLGYKNKTGPLIFFLKKKKKKKKKYVQEKGSQIPENSRRISGTYLGRN